MTIHIDEIIRSRRKTVALEIKQDASLVVKAPYLMPMWYIRYFIQKKESWIRKQQRRMQERQKLKVEYEDNNLLWFLGEQYPFQYSKNKKLAFQEGIFLVPQNLKKTFKDMFIEWYKKQAREVITKRVEYYAHKYNLQYKNIRITSAETRWGSCSSSNNLNFTWKLIMAPQDVVDYVVVHELAHTLQKNHSQKFWNEVKAMMPDYKQKEKWLKEKGFLLRI